MAVFSEPFMYKIVFERAKAKPAESCTAILYFEICDLCDERPFSIQRAFAKIAREMYGGKV